MKLDNAAFCAFGALTLFACGAAPDGTTNGGTTSEDSGRLSQAQQVGHKRPPAEVNFDWDSSYLGIADGDAVDTQYSGVTFSCDRCSTVYARYPGFYGNGVSPI